MRVGLFGNKDNLAPNSVEFELYLETTSDYLDHVLLTVINIIDNIKSPHIPLP